MQLPQQELLILHLWEGFKRYMSPLKWYVCAHLYFCGQKICIPFTTLSEGTGAETKELLYYNITFAQVFNKHTLKRILV